MQFSNADVIMLATRIPKILYSIQTGKNGF